MSIAANVSRIPTQSLETVPIIDGIPRKQRPMDVRMFGFDTPFPSTLERVIPEELQMAFNAPTKSCVRDPRAKARTPADVRELPNSYEFVVDMPGLKPGDVKVQLEEENVLVVSGERKREEEEEGGGKYLRMERRMGKLMRRLEVPGDANVEAISAVCRDGVLTVTVEKVPPAEPKKPRTIEVKIG